MSANRNSRSNRSRTLCSPSGVGIGIGARGRGRRNLNQFNSSIIINWNWANNHTSQIDSLITRRVSSSYLIEPEFDSCYITQIVKKFQNNHELKELLRKEQTNEFLNIYLN